MVDTDALRMVARHCELEYGVQLILDAADEIDAWVKDWNTAARFRVEWANDPERQRRQATWKSELDKSWELGLEE
jgi:hypothetical protein